MCEKTLTAFGEKFNTEILSFPNKLKLKFDSKVLYTFGGFWYKPEDCDTFLDKEHCFIWHKDYPNYFFLLSTGKYIRKENVELIETEEKSLIKWMDEIIPDSGKFEFNQFTYSSYTCKDLCGIYYKHDNYLISLDIKKYVAKRNAIIIHKDDDCENENKESVAQQSENMTIEKQKSVVFSKQQSDSYVPFIRKNSDGTYDFQGNKVNKVRYESNGRYYFVGHRNNNPVNYIEIEECRAKIIDDKNKFIITKKLNDTYIGEDKFEYIKFPLNSCIQVGIKSNEGFMRKDLYEEHIKGKNTFPWDCSWFIKIEDVEVIDVITLEQKRKFKFTKKLDGKYYFDEIDHPLVTIKNPKIKEMKLINDIWSDVNKSSMSFYVIENDMVIIEEEKPKFKIKKTISGLLGEDNRLYYRDNNHFYSITFDINKPKCIYHKDHVEIIEETPTIKIRRMTSHEEMIFNKKSLYPLYIDNAYNVYWKEIKGYDCYWRVFCRLSNIFFKLEKHEVNQLMIVDKLE